MRRALTTISAATMLFLSSCNLPTEPQPRANSAASTDAPTRNRAARFVRSLQPACSNPAPLLLVRCSAPGYIVRFKSGTDPNAVASILAGRYGFTVASIYSEQYTGFPGFYAIISLQSVALLRCEPSVETIE